MKITLRLRQATFDDLHAMASGDLESGAVLLAHLVDVDAEHIVLLGSELVSVPDDAYTRRTDHALTVTSEGYIHALKKARDQGQVALWVHSHPGDGSDTRPSEHDDVVNHQLRDLFAERTDSGLYGFLVVGHAGSTMTFTGRIDGRASGAIERLNVVGERWSFLSAADSPAGGDHELFDRNIRAFGGQVQDTIGALTVAIVGAGGTGSAVAEQLTRLGVRSLVLIDPDYLSTSNLTRVYGSTPADVGRSKVEVLADHLERIADGVKVRRIVGAVTEESVARELRAADVIFGCTDDNAGRLRLSRMPYYYLAPLIDMGVQIPSAADDTISGIFARITTLFPGAACLVCRERIDLALAEAEMRSQLVQERLEREGYAPALPGVEPAVVAFTTMVAAAAVSEFLERLVGYGDSPTPSELILYIHDRAIRGNVEDPHAGHYCDPLRDLAGTDKEVFLGLNWAS